MQPFEPQECTARADKDTGLGTERFRMTYPSRPPDCDEMTVFTWRNGKITAIRAFHDTAASGIAVPRESAGSGEALFQRPRRCAIYDAIVVGAWCAGSPTAMRLARQGYLVLL